MRTVILDFLCLHFPTLSDITDIAKPVPISIFILMLYPDNIFTWQTLQFESDRQSEYVHVSDSYGTEYPLNDSPEINVLTITSRTSFSVIFLEDCECLFYSNAAIHNTLCFACNSIATLSLASIGTLSSTTF